MIKSIACSLAGFLLVSTAMADEKKSFAQKTDVEIYGEVRAWAEVGSADNKDLSLETGDTKLGAKAKHKISPVLTGFGELSFDLNAATNTVVTRYAYAGDAREQIRMYSRKRPGIKQLLNLRPKYGMSFNVCYMDKVEYRDVIKYRKYVRGSFYT